MRRLIALLIVLALGLGAVLLTVGGGADDGGDGGSAGRDGRLDDVTVEGAAGEKPTVRIDEPLAASEDGRRVVADGDGEEIDVEATVTFDYLAVDGRDGAELDASWGRAPVTFDLGAGELIAALADGLVGTRVGGRVVLAVPQQPDEEQVTQGAPESVVYVLDIRAVRHPLERAQGTPVAPPAGLPTVTLDEGAGGKPSITVPDAAPPADLVVQPLITGTGPVVEAGQTLVAHYTGIVWGGEQFDSSWDREQPATFPIGSGGVIAGWDEGLVGQTIGSQILLVVPSAKGYPEGNPDAGIAAGDTIVFVVDLLDAY